MPREINFIDNAAATDAFTCITIDTNKAIQSWRLSILAHEWLNGDGSLKPAEKLTAANQEKLKAILAALDKGQPIEKPVLGIGIMDNIEIGSGRAEFIALYTQGIKHIQAHIPKSNDADFKDFT